MANIYPSRIFHCLGDTVTRSSWLFSCKLPHEILSRKTRVLGLANDKTA